MQTIARLLLAALGAAAIAASPGAKAAAAGPELYHGFTLIDPASHRRTPDSWIVVRDGRIERIGAGALPAGVAQDRRRDLHGRFVLPGFIDAHAHITETGMIKVEMRGGAPAVTMEPDERITRHNARIALARGVTTVRNPGGDPVANEYYAAMVASGAWQGPEAISAGAVIEPPPFTGSLFVYPRTPAEWDAEAAREAALGMRYFKLYQDLSEPELASGIAAAHRHGLKAIAHLNKVSWTRAVELGIDGLEHDLPTSPDLLEPAQRAKFVDRPDSTFMYRWFELADYDGPLIQRLIRLMARRRVATDMTYVVNEIVFDIDQLDRVYPAEERIHDIPERRDAALAGLKASAAGWTPDDFNRARAVFPKMLEFGRRLHEAGVPMMIGTDAGGGAFYARELELHVQAGIPVWDVLKMATSDAADIIGIGARTGRIRRGYEADLVILDADPIADIRAAGQVYAVVDNGTFLLSDDLKKSVP